MELRQRLLAILAADAAGFSRLMAADEPQTVAALDAARLVFRAHVESHHGRVVDMAGDSVLAVFETAAGAVSAALAIQDELHSAAAGVAAPRRMEFRIGVHLGDVIEKPDGTVYGDGVNIAARLQGLATPGGVAASDAVRSAVRGRGRVVFDDAGEHVVKNIPGSVRAYAVRAEGALATSAVATPAPRARPSRRFAAAAVAGLVLVAASVGAIGWYSWWTARGQAPGPAGAPLTLPTKPSIAVLPFDNIGGDPEQAYFADGITEDLITDLSKVAGLFVIARNSTFVYKGKARDIREVARALGVRYVLEGSVRRSGHAVRVNAQLIDATSGGHMWADRYDGDLSDIFTLQDRVTRSVVGALAVELTKDDRERVAARSGTENPEAYDVFLKGWRHYLRQTPEDFRQAIAFFTRATELDPKYGRPYAALAALYWDVATRTWGPAVGLHRLHEPQARAEYFLARALRDPTPLAHEVASAMALHARRYDDAVTEASKAIASDPNDANGYVALASALSFMGKPREALDLIERAIRLNPHFPSYYLYQQGLAHFGLERLDDAAASLERALAMNPEDYWAQRLLLSTYGLLARRERSAKLLADMSQAAERRGVAYIDPVTIRALSYWHPFANPVDAERFAQGLRNAGVPD